jgi:imidazolonepropionase-like amidohydrolase
MKRLLLPAAALALTSPANAQDLTVTPGRPAEPVYLYNATLHTVDQGVLERAGLLLRDGKIAAVLRAGQMPDSPAETTIKIDLLGKHVWPGLISPWTALGLSEIGSLPDTIDLDEVGDANPEVRAAVGVNPDATAIPVTRRHGVLSVGVAPSGGLVPGRLSVLSLAGWTAEDMTVRADAGLVIEWPVSAPPQRGRGRRGRSEANPQEDPRERAAKAIAQLGELFAQARAYARARQADPELATDLRLLGMTAVLERQTPVFVRASTREQIEQAVDWAVREGVRLVVAGGESALSCVELLRRHDVPLIVASPHRLPARRDADYDEAFVLPAKIAAASLRWCLAHDFAGYANERNLPYTMGTAIAHGLARDAALRALTLSAAEILGVADRLGSLTAGKDATLFATDGEPWELETKVTDVWIGGRKLDLASKQTELRRKYLEKYRQLEGK